MNIRKRNIQKIISVALVMALAMGLFPAAVFGNNDTCPECKVVSVNVVVKWDDNDNKDKTRPNAVSGTLKSIVKACSTCDRKGKESSVPYTVKAGKWQTTLKQLQDGTFTLEPNKVDRYDAPQCTWDAGSKTFTVTYKRKQDDKDRSKQDDKDKQKQDDKDKQKQDDKDKQKQDDKDKNKILKENVTVNVKWVGDEHTKNLRPTSIEVGLHKNGVGLGLQTAKGSGSVWTCSFNVVKTPGPYAVTVNGNHPIPGYKTEIFWDKAGTVCTITNTLQNQVHQPKDENKIVKENVTVNVKWVGDEHTKNLRPTSVEVGLHKNGVGLGLQTAKGFGSVWTCSFNVVKTPGPYVVIFNHNQPIPNYTTEVSWNKTGTVCTITNTLKSQAPPQPVKPKETVTVKMVWNDHNNAKFLRPNKVDVTLYKNLHGKMDFLGRSIVTERSKWICSFAGLNPRIPGQYTVNAYVPGYDTVVAVDPADPTGKSFIVTNTLKKNVVLAPCYTSKPKYYEVPAFSVIRGKNPITVVNTVVPLVPKAGV